MLSIISDGQTLLLILALLYLTECLIWVKKQSVVFVSFLWELGYRSWGPLLTVPFALLQGYIFQRTRSLPYVVTVHLTFDAIIFGILVHAYNPAIADIFLTDPR